ncbi:NAD(P)/FAD-dependent oxidoreductase [Roseiconus nitratireducens]|uniref:NAD(P)/FAD-dependent oxidoreductase n=1 Tax=Roseiconus nitratireducens TaxID=2605748 RepID=A0A5M6CWU2_9BACT|nr:FAD-dependent oxidoreductase [Roseiconus nitratireducens]KAA5539697.1 NAD(P)/FAD-dependent oxidoreductase [Roseiconus nitratireducens]
MSIAPATSAATPGSRAAAPGETSVRTRLIIVGGGMAGFGLCDRLVRANALDRYETTIIGEEPQPAYDRVNLSRYFADPSPDRLLLAPREWYAAHGVQLRTGRRVVQIHRDHAVIVDDHGQIDPYDQLVLATGSHAFVPPIPGADLEGVFVYRTLSDLQSIARACRQRQAKVGAVIGGGLLGLEAAKVLQDLGLSVSVIEMAPGLMPKQLDSEAAGFLRERIESIGIKIHLVRRTQSIRHRDGGGLTIDFFNAEPLDVDLLIIAAGVRPNDELAESAGLEIGPRRGIAVDECLQTTDPNIYAIGECASFRDHVYGLAAPCYRMADVLAQRLCGQASTFTGADESAELKLLGVQVASLGRIIGESPGGNVITHHDDRGYRKLLVERGRIAGASCVGDWDEVPQIRQAIQKGQRLWSWQRKRFLKTGSPWAPGGALPVTQWPPDATVCSCLSIPKRTISELVAQGITDPLQIAESCGASTACGSCKSLVSELAGATPGHTVLPGANVMLVASLVALLMGAIWMVAPPVDMADSVQSAWRNVDVLWRSDLARKVTGYTLLTLTLLGLVISLRKRWNWFRFGSYGFWRAVHGVLGTSVIVGVAIHTGLRLGSNLNFLLAVCFLSAGVLGGITGLASSLENRLIGTTGMLVRKYRPRLTRLHLWLTWPLPVLIALHILSFYWFSD